VKADAELKQCAELYVHAGRVWVNAGLTISGLRVGTLSDENGYNVWTGPIQKTDYEALTDARAKLAELGAVGWDAMTGTPKEGV
jgi:hypothetical protein